MLVKETVEDDLQLIGDQRFHQFDQTENPVQLIEVGRVLAVEGIVEQQLKLNGVEI